MSSEVKSVFLIGKPTCKKTELLLHTQNEYCRVINYYIQNLIHMPSAYLDVFNNNPTSSLLRTYEKETRHIHKLGSAYGQNMLDHAVKELHNHFTRIRNKLYGYVQEQHKEMLPYVSFISLLNCAVTNTDELEVIQTLIDYEKQKKKPDSEKIEAYTNLLQWLESLSAEFRTDYKEQISTLFYERLHTWKLPKVRHTPLQLDSRVSTIEKSHSTREDFVVHVKLLGSKDRVSFPVSTSQKGKRRMTQYSTGSMNITLKNGNVHIGVPIKKSVKTKKIKKGVVLAGDLGITDFIRTNTGSTYGSGRGLVHIYEELVEKKLGNRSSLRNRRKAYQKELRTCECDPVKEVLRNKIKNISRMLEGKKKIQARTRSYNHIVDKELHVAYKSFVKEAEHLPCLVALENLLLDDFNRGKKSNKRDSMWVRGQLMKRITEALHWKGISYVLVDPAYTSQTCSKCSHVDSNNRNGKQFVCTVCKYSCDADYNAAVNIGERAYDEGLKGIVETYKFNKKLRHTHIKELLQKRHSSYMESLASV